MERRNFNQLLALGSLGLAFSSPITNKKISIYFYVYNLRLLYKIL